MRTPNIPAPEIREKKLRRKNTRKKFKAQLRIQDGFQNGDSLDTGSSSSACSSEASSLVSECPVEMSSVNTSVGVNIPKLCDTKERAEAKSPIALDCEMVGVGDEKKSALARCSMVNYQGNVIYDVYVKPDQPITDYRTQWSGIRPEHLVNAISLRKARKQTKRLLKNRVLVGHALQFDFKVLKLTHPHFLVRDTSKFVPLRVHAGLSSNLTPSLKRLSSNLLECDIQMSEHCSVEDARAAMALYKLYEENWEKDLMGTGETSYLGDAFWPSWTNTKRN